MAIHFDCGLGGGGTTSTSIILVSSAGICTTSSSDFRSGEDIFEWFLSFLAVFE